MEINQIEVSDKLKQGSYTIITHSNGTPPKSRINKYRPFGIADEKEQDIKKLIEHGQQTFMKGSLNHEKRRICKNRSFRGIGGGLRKGLPRRA